MPLVNPLVFTIHLVCTLLQKKENDPKWLLGHFCFSFFGPNSGWEILIFFVLFSYIRDSGVSGIFTRSASSPKL